MSAGSVHDPQAMKHCSLFPTALGPCGVAWRGTTVIATRLPGRHPAETIAGLGARTGATRGEPPPAVRRAIDSMTALLEGQKVDLSFVDCDFGDVEPFAARVYAATRAIPAGETSTYGAIALQLGDQGLARQVGWALGRNPLPIIVPCHRVVGAGGRLVGFSAPGGVGTKLKLLAIERARIGEAPGLFDDLPFPVPPTRSPRR